MKMRRINNLNLQKGNRKEMKMRRLVLLAVLVLGLSGLSASADTYVAPYGSDGATTGLTTILDTIYGVGNYARVADVSDNTWWQIAGPGGATVEAKYAGNGNDLWTATTGGALDKLVVMGVAGLTGTIAPSVNPFLFADVTTGGSLSGSGGKYFVSDAELNKGEDHMVTFKLIGSYGILHPDTYVIAWEDLQYSGSDKDFNDLVVEVSGVKPVPDGGLTVALLGGAVALIGAFGRKLRK